MRPHQPRARQVPKKVEFLAAALAIALTGLASCGSSPKHQASPTSSAVQPESTTAATSTTTVTTIAPPVTTTTALATATTGTSTTTVLPPGFSRTSIARNVTQLVAVPAKHLVPSQLRVAPTGTSAELTAALFSVVNSSAPVMERPLLISPGSADLVPGEQLTVVATHLGARPRPAHYALFILSGPGGTFQEQRLVEVSHGISEAVITLPTTMAPGQWVIAVQDASEVAFSGDVPKPGHYDLVDIGIFFAS